MNYYLTPMQTTKLPHEMPSVVEQLQLYYKLHSLLSIINSMSTIVICTLPTIILALLSCLYICILQRKIAKLYTHAHTHIHTHAHIHTRTHVHTHTHTHTRFRVLTFCTQLPSHSFNNMLLAFHQTIH